MPAVPASADRLGRMLRRLPRLLFRDIEGGDARRRRLLAIVQGVATGLGSRIVGVLVGFLSVPLTIGYLGPERYGAWLTLASLLAWLQLADLGLGSGLNTAVSTALGQDRPDLIRTHVANAALVLSAVAAVTGVAAAVAWPFLDWPAIFGLHDAGAGAEIGPAVAAALAIFLLQFPLSLPGRLLTATQQGRLSNYWTMGASVLSLGSLLLVTRSGGGLLSLVLAVSGTWLAVNAASTVWLFAVHRPDLLPRPRDVHLGQMRAVGGMGSRFFLIQVMALVTFQTDTLVISHYLGAADVPAYSLTYNLFNYTTLPHSILFAYLWAAYGEAIARGDIAWVRRVARLSLAGGLLFTGTAAAVLVAVAAPFIGWWSAGHVRPSASLVHWMAAWSMVNALTGPMVCLLAAAAHLRWQTVYSACAAVANIALSVMLVQRWGVTGVIAGTVLAYAAFVCGPIILDGEALLRRLSLRASTPV